MVSILPSLVFSNTSYTTVARLKTSIPASLSNSQSNLDKCKSSDFLISQLTAKATVTKTAWYGIKTDMQTNEIE